MGSHRSATTTRWRSLTVLVSLLAACDRNGSDLVLVGTVERTLIEMVAPVSETLIDLPAGRGQRVHTGDVLAQLDPSIAEAEVAGAEARLAGARTAQATAANEFERVTGLRRAHVASEQDLERAQLARDEAAARLREAQAVLAAAVHRLDELVLRAPVDGTVDQTPFDPGERVPAGGVVSVLLDAGAPWVRVWVPEQRASVIHLGLTAQVTIDGIATPLVGRVDDVAREPAFTPHFALTERDRVHLVYEARVVLPDAPPDLRPGLPAEVRITLERAS
jgi:HlyD family secretion protein